MNRTRLIAEAAAVMLLAGLGFTAGRAAFLAAPSQPFSQAEFGPAVMVAAGRGFVNPEPAPGGDLERFLLMRTETLDFAAIDIARVAEPDQFQNMHRYLLSVVGYWWRASEISWRRLAEVAGAVHALSVLATFVLLRLFVPLAPAAIGAAWLASSPLQLLYAPHLRDFVKGAFILAAIPAIAALVMSSSSRRALVALAGLTGLVIGVGLGFRMDVLIMLPIAVVSVLLFRGGRPWLGLGDKALAIGALLLALAVSGWPIWSRLSSGGSNAIHVVLLGSADSFDSRLGVEPASYGYLPFYSDTYLTNVLRVRAAGATGRDIRMPSAEYDAAGFALWRQWLRHFPADAHTRLLAATDGVLNLAFDNPTPGSAGRWPVAMALGALFAWLNEWRGWGWLLGLALIAAAARRGIGPACFAALMLGALAGYPSLQYDPRHYFHLQVIPIAVMVVTLWAAVSALAKLARPRPEPPPARTVLAMPRAAALAVAIILAVTVVPATTLRAYQAGHLATTWAGFLAADRSAMAVEFVALGANRWVARWPDVQGLPTGVAGLRAAYYVAEFRAVAAHEAMAIGLRYGQAPSYSPCALTRRLTTSQGLARFAFATYSLDGDSSFDGIELGTEMKQRLVGVYRAAATPGGVPVELRLASDWDQRRLYQRLIREERLQADDTGLALFAPPDRCGSHLAFIDASLSAAWQVGRDRIGTTASPAVTVDARGIVVEGSANAAAPELATLAPVMLAAGDALVARVWIGAGGVSLRLLRDGAPSHEVIIPRPGVSVVVIPVTQAATYVPQVASAAPGWRSDLRFNLDRVGVVRADGRVTTGEALP